MGVVREEPRRAVWATRRETVEVLVIVGQPARLPLPEASLKARVVQSDLLISRRNLPHWELGGSTYFLTYHCAKSITLDGPARSIVLENWRYWHGERYLLHAVVVMPDHVHVLITPKSDGKGGWFSLQNILHTNKGYTAYEINKHRGSNIRIWQDERFDRIVRDTNEFLEKWTYIANNTGQVRVGPTNRNVPMALPESRCMGRGREEPRPAAWATRRQKILKVAQPARLCLPTSAKFSPHSRCKSSLCLPWIDQGSPEMRWSSP